MRKRIHFIITLLLLVIITGKATAQQPLWQPVGSPSFSDWKGITAAGDGAGIVGAAGTAVYTYPDGKSYSRGFRNVHEGTADWRAWDGLRYEVFLENDSPVELQTSFSVPAEMATHYQPECKALVKIAGRGWHAVYLPFTGFDINKAQLGLLLFVKAMSVKVLTTGAAVRLRQVQLTKGNMVSLSTAVKGKPATKDAPAIYEVWVGNTSDQLQSVSLRFKQYGWEGMTATVQPSSVDLKPGESKRCEVVVTPTERVPAGRQEKQLLMAIANGNAATAAGLELVTVTALPHPYILHNTARWEEVKEKARLYDWARKEQDRYTRIATAWEVPQIKDKNFQFDSHGRYLFLTSEEHNLMAAGIAYRLTGKKEFAEKVATFLRRLSAPEDGYITTYRGCSQSFVQEGHFFQHIAMAYDMIFDAGVMSREDTRNMETTFRAVIETIDRDNNAGAINNWNLSEITGALYCALMLQDLSLANRFFSGPNGVTDQLAQGVMNDGWWYECSISYNVWCTSEFSQIALAMEPFGVNFKDMQLPSGVTPYFSLMPSFRKPGLYGMNFDKWGPVTKNTVGIKDMWDALPRFADYRGVMFGVNDAAENKLAGQAFELAYYLYRDPEYAAIISRGNERDLLYGVPDLPATPSKLMTQSAYADNVGLVMLRSQTKERPQREQIQAVLHYGTHGGYHGHFDRTGLVSLMRYGRSFYNPESVWYSYAPFMYKFYVQTSLSKNMVVVDQKMQEPTPSARPLFYSGKMMQATVTETRSRWSNPPYGGMQYSDLGGIPFKGKTELEARSVPIPPNAPAYGSLTDFTEPVLQRRVMVVTDDYVVLADYMEAAKEHTFDCLFQMKGFKGLEAPVKKWLRHDAQMNPDPLGSAQFVTDCDWWSVQGPAKSSFTMCWGADCDNEGTRTAYNEEGALHLDVFSLWPLKKEIMAGNAPEPHGTEKQLSYAVKGDGKVLQEGKLGAWILGKAEINIPVGGLTALVLETHTATIYGENRSTVKYKPTVFWGDAVVVLSDGKTIPVSELSPVTEGILANAYPGLDYFGGPVKIEGIAYKHALPGMPDQLDKTGSIRIDLSKLNAVAFKAVLGSDYPSGNEDARRKTYAVRSKGKKASFLTIIEPYENTAVIKKAEAVSDHKIKVELKDGRVQEITIDHLEGDGRDIKINMTESLNGKVIRTETAKE